LEPNQSIESCAKFLDSSLNLAFAQEITCKQPSKTMTIILIVGILTILVGLGLSNLVEADHSLENRKGTFLVSKNNNNVSRSKAKAGLDPLECKHKMPPVHPLYV
jgi:hypothetical protein